MVYIRGDGGIGRVSAEFTHKKVCDCHLCTTSTPDCNSSLLAVNRRAHSEHVIMKDIELANFDHVLKLEVVEVTGVPCAYTVELDVLLIDGKSEAEAPGISGFDNRFV